MPDNLNPPRDPVVYLFWRAWRAVRPPAPPPVLLRFLEAVEVSDLSIPLNASRKYRVEGLDAGGLPVAPPTPITFTSADPSIVRAVPNEAEVMLVAQAVGETILSVKAGELRLDLSVRVPSPAVSIRLVEVDPPTPA